MSTDDRHRRPHLDRTDPIRSWATLVGGGVPRPDADDRPGAAPSGTAGRVTDAVTKSVEIGYRVIDDYLQQGQRVARRLSDGGSGPDVWATEIQDLGVRMARYASDFMAAWMELLELTARGADGGPRPAEAAASSAETRVPPAPNEAPPVARPEGGARVRVAVRSLLPVEVDVDYRPERATGPGVRVHALRALEPDKPRIEDVAFRPGAVDDAPTLVVRVPDEQPAGSYEGLLVDEGTNRPVGSVRVDVGARTDESAR